MKIAKPAAIAAATIAAVAGVLALNPSQSSVSAQSTSTTSGQAAGIGATSSGSTTTSNSSTGTQTVTGAAASSPYGDMQVQATITNGTITDITWVQLPGDGHSMRINDYAAPLLVQEALQAQSYQVDAVSGATYTSEGFQQSLQSAHTQADFTV